MTFFLDKGMMFFLDKGALWRPMIDIIKDYFKTIQEVIDTLVQRPEELIEKKYFESAQSAVEGVAYTMIAVFFLIDMIQNVLLKTDELRVEDVVKALLKLLVARACIGFTPQLLKAFFSTSTKILLAWKNDTLPITKSDDAAYDILKGMGLEYGGLFSSDTLTELGFFVVHIIDFIVLKISTVVMKAIAIARGFELLILQLLSSIPMAFLPWSETKDIPKRFLLNYFAVCLQGVVMIAGAVVLSSLVSPLDDNKGALEITSYTIVYLLTLLKSGQISKQILGVA